MHCLTCQYDLRNLTEHRCPECGRPFDPSDECTFDGVSPGLRLAVTIGLLVFAVSVIGLPLLTWLVRLARLD